MTGAMNPWLLLGVLLAVLAVFGSGAKVGSDWNEAKHLEALIKQQKLADQETKRANEVATIYGDSLNTANDKAAQLRKELNDVRTSLATCTPDTGLRFTGAFVSLRNDALQTNAADSSEPAGAAAGAGATPAELLENDIENGRRWKACRDQANALIDILR